MSSYMFPNFILFLWREGRIINWFTIPSLYLRRNTKKILFQHKVIKEYLQIPASCSCLKTYEVCQKKWWHPYQETEAINTYQKMHIKSWHKPFNCQLRLLPFPEEAQWPVKMLISLKSYIQNELKIPSVVLDVC